MPIAMQEPEKRPDDIDRLERSCGGHSMVHPLRRVLLAAPKAMGWESPDKTAQWKSLGYFHAPQADTAQRQHSELLGLLSSRGIAVDELKRADSLSLDAVYAHDASLQTDAGMICLSMGKEARLAEPARHETMFDELQIPVLGKIEPPGRAEGGDLVWLDGSTLLAGRGYRTNGEGIRQLQDLLEPLGVVVVEAPLPHGRGPEFCLHLMSLMSMLDSHTVLIDAPWLSVATLEFLEKRGLRTIPIVPAERETMACNVLSLDGSSLIALEENPLTNARMAKEGFEILTFPGTELCQNGGGGPTCLTRPVLRRA